MILAQVACAQNGKLASFGREDGGTERGLGKMVG